jgi:hypothetical protein
VNKQVKKSQISVFIGLAGFLVAIVASSYFLYFMWDSQIEGNPYKVAVEKGDKLYEVRLFGSDFAFDQKKAENHLYLNSFVNLADLIAIGYGDYQTEKTENPFFAGKIVNVDLVKYIQTNTEFSNAKDSYQTFIFYDQNRNQILNYNPNIQNDYVPKLLPTYPAFSKNSNRNYIFSRNFVDVTKLFKEKLNLTINVRVDDSNKLLIISFS